MNASARSLILCLFVGAVGPACAADDLGVAEDDWSEPIVSADGKADGILDLAPALSFGRESTGTVGGQALQVFALDLRKRDRFTLVMRKTGGDLVPSTTLYFGVGDAVSSATFESSSGSVTRTFEIGDTGRYYVAARAYRGRGAGGFSLLATCTGGPCAGEAPPAGEALTVSQRGHCVDAARRCAFEGLPRFNGHVGPARARSLFEACISSVALEAGTVACTTACAALTDEDESAVELCDDVIGGLPFYADQSGACLVKANACVDDCVYAGHGSDELATKLWTTHGSLCWHSGLNGTCDGYARGHEVCGGDYAEGSTAECLALCHATIGAHVEDVDTTCEEQCE